MSDLCFFSFFMIPSNIYPFPSQGATFVAGDRSMKPQGGTSFDIITCSCPLPETASPAAANQVTYDDPKVLGHPLDYCFHLNELCGKEAADAYCKSYGSQSSVDFSKVRCNLVYCCISLFSPCHDFWGCFSIYPFIHINVLAYYPCFLW